MTSRATRPRSVSKPAPDLTSRAYWNGTIKMSLSKFFILTIVRGLAVPEMLTREAYGAINGALALPSIVAKATAPLAAAVLRAATGSYDALLMAVLAGSVVVALGFWSAALSRPV